MFTGYKYLQKRASLHNLGEMRKLAYSVKGFQNILAAINKDVGAFSGSMNWNKLLANATPAQRYQLANLNNLRNFGNNNHYITEAINKGGYTLNPNNTYTHANMLTGTGQANMGEFRNQIMANRRAISVDPNTGGLVMGAGTGHEIALDRMPMYNKPNGYFMPVYSTAANDMDIRQMSPQMQRRLAKWYNTAEGQDYQKLHNIGYMDEQGNMNPWINSTTDIGHWSMNPVVRAKALERRNFLEQLRQQQANPNAPQGTPNQQQGTGTDATPTTWKDVLLGGGVIGGTLGGLGYGLYSLGTADSAAAASPADYDPAMYYYRPK